MGRIAISQMETHKYGLNYLTRQEALTNFARRADAQGPADRPGRLDGHVDHKEFTATMNSLNQELAKELGYQPTPHVISQHLRGNTQSLDNAPFSSRATEIARELDEGSNLTYELTTTAPQRMMNSVRHSIRMFFINIGIL